MSVETKTINYPCFNLTTAICENANEGFNLKSVAATISIVVFPIIVAIAALEAIFDLLALPVVFAINYLTPAETQGQFKGLKITRAVNQQQRQVAIQERELAPVNSTKFSGTLYLNQQLTAAKAE